MLDRTMSYRGVKRNVLSTPGYSANQAVLSEQLLAPDNPNLTVLLPPWHGGGKFYERLASRLIARGNAVLVYDFHDDILKPDVDEVVASFHQIQSHVSDRLHELRDTERYQSVSLIAASLGTPILAMVASMFPDFDKATMITPGSDLAKCMWQGIRTAHIRRAFESQGVEQQQLETAWSSLAPVNHTASMVGKDLSLIISKTDRIIPTRFQHEYASVLNVNDIVPDVTSSNLGHYGTIGRFCLSGNMS
jgi:hypothetical protein